MLEKMQFIEALTPTWHSIVHGKVITRKCIHPPFPKVCCLIEALTHTCTGTALTTLWVVLTKYFFAVNLHMWYCIRLLLHFFLCTTFIMLLSIA